MINKERFSKTLIPIITFPVKYFFKFAKFCLVGHINCL